ncbi:MAG: hypothetical protein H7Y19_04585 [Luteimonas sp.]|nr:hypothetical protein [Luteimonas sp.]
MRQSRANNAGSPKRPAGVVAVGRHAQHRRQIAMQVDRKAVGRWRSRGQHDMLDQALEGFAGLRADVGTGQCDPELFDLPPVDVRGIRTKPDHGRVGIGLARCRLKCGPARLQLSNPDFDGRVPDSVLNGFEHVVQSALDIGQLDVQLARSAHRVFLGGNRLLVKDPHKLRHEIGHQHAHL